MVELEKLIIRGGGGKEMHGGRNGGVEVEVEFSIE